MELYHEIAEIAGFSAIGHTRASSFFEAVTEFENRSVLILDMNMPEMDGTEVIRRLAKKENAPALILVSGHDKQTLQAVEKICQAYDLEVIGSFTKPVLFDDLLQLIEQQLTVTEVSQQKTHS